VVIATVTRVGGDAWVAPVSWVEAALWEELEAGGLVLDAMLMMSWIRLQKNKRLTGGGRCGRTVRGRRGLRGCRIGTQLCGRGLGRCGNTGIADGLHILEILDSALIRLLLKDGGSTNGLNTEDGVKRVGVYSLFRSLGRRRLPSLRTRSLGQ
jgi:hypothetical protein